MSHEMFMSGVMLVQGCIVLALVALVYMWGLTRREIMQLQFYLINSKAMDLNMLLSTLALALEHESDAAKAERISRTMDIAAEELANHKERWETKH